MNLPASPPSSQFAHRFIFQYNPFVLQKPEWGFAGRSKYGIHYKKCVLQTRLGRRERTLCGTGARPLFKQRFENKLLKWIPPGGDGVVLFCKDSGTATQSRNVAAFLKNV